MGLPINAVITFQIGTGVFTQDPTAEMWNEAETLAPVAIEASLSQEKPPEVVEVAGLNPSSLYVEGRVKPKTKLPPGLHNSTPATVVIRNLADPNGPNVEGRFIYLPSVQSKFKAVTNSLGLFIRGYVEVA